MSTSSNTYDAIVIGSGISGGWAAKDLRDNGLKTLVLECNMEHLKDYPTATKNPWEFPHVENYHGLFLKKIRWWESGALVFTCGNLCRHLW